MKAIVLGGLVGSLPPLLFAMLNLPGTWPSAIAMVLAGILLVAVAHVRGEGPAVRIALKDRSLWLTGGIVAATTVASSISVSYVSVAGAAFAAQLTPVAVVILGPFYGERATRRDTLAVVIGIGAALVLASNGSPGPAAGTLVWLGVLLAAAASLGSGLVYLQQRRRARRDAAPLPTQAALLLSGGFVILLIPDGVPTVGLREIGLILAVAASFSVSNLLFFIGIRRVRASQAVVARPLSAISSALLAALVLHQRLTPSVALGCALALTASGLAARQARPQAQSPPGESAEASA